MARPERVQIRHVALPLRRPFVSAGTRMGSRDVVLVRMELGGAVGWGEASPVPGYSSASLDEVWAALAAAGPEIASGRPAPRGIPAEARGALDGARRDLEASAAGIPLWRALGGRGEAVPAGAVTGLATTPAALADEVAGYRAAGYRAVKLKIAPGRDLAPVDAVRAAHPDLVIGADANGSYPAGTVPVELDGFDLAYLEQPLAAGDLAGHARLRSVMTTPICLDESISGGADLDRAVAGGAADVVNLKAGRLGGHDMLRQVHDAARAAGLTLRAGGMIETGVGRAHLLAAATLPGFTVVGDVAGSERHFADDLVDPPWTVAGGVIELSERPGIGVTVDEDAVAATTVRTAAWHR